MSKIKSGYWNQLTSEDYLRFEQYVVPTKDTRSPQDALKQHGAYKGSLEVQKRLKQRFKNANTA